MLNLKQIVELYGEGNNIIIDCKRTLIKGNKEQILKSNLSNFDIKPRAFDLTEKKGHLIIYMD